MATKVTDDALVEYLESHMVYNKLQQAMEALAINKPDNPCAFLRDLFNPAKPECKTPHRIIILGPPSSGRSTLCKRLAEKFGCKLIRADRRSSALGSTEIIDFIRAQLQQCSGESWVLDDFPASELEAFSLRISPDCLPTIAIDLQLPLDVVLSRATGEPEKEQLRKRYEAYRITRPAYFKVFEYCLRVVDCIDASFDEIEKRATDILLGAQIVKTGSNEVLPRGPAIIDDKSEVIAYTLSRVPNTRPLIESIN